MHEVKSETFKIGNQVINTLIHLSTFIHVNIKIELPSSLLK